MLTQMTSTMCFDYMAILLDKQALAEYDFTVNVKLPDVSEQHVLHVKNGVLLVYKNAQQEDADVSLTCPKNALFYILQHNAEGLSTLPVEGNRELLTLLASSMNQFPLSGINPFNIVEP